MMQLIGEIYYINVSMVAYLIKVLKQRRDKNYFHFALFSLKEGEHYFLVQNYRKNLGANADTKNIIGNYERRKLKTNVKNNINRSKFFVFPNSLKNNVYIVIFNFLGNYWREFPFSENSYSLMLYLQMVIEEKGCTYFAVTIYFFIDLSFSLENFFQCILTR